MKHEPLSQSATLSVEQARERIRAVVSPLAQSENVALRDALSRVLAREVISPLDVPAHDNSAMDGYAFDGGALVSGAALTLAVAGQAYAGHGYDGPVSHGQCVRIMTGAPLPAGCDTVAPHELVSRSGDTVTFASAAFKRGANVRLRGEDLRAGASALPAGRILRPADLGLLASLGIAQVEVKRRLKVALFSTGDELQTLGEALEPGRIYDSNRYTLLGMLTRLGCEVLDSAPVHDDPVALEAALRAAGTQADVVITSGGVSAGDADYTRQVMAELGDIAFWQLEMRPGRPLAFGPMFMEGRQSWLFGLPGNPVAAMVAFYCIVREGLLKMMGAAASPLPLLRAAAGDVIRKRLGRTEYQRGIVSRSADGNPEVRLTGAQGSGILRSMAEANCLIVLGPEQGDVQPGEPVDVLLFEGLV
jgi:molybdopterin molybdotransferase